MKVATEAYRSSPQSSFGTLYARLGLKVKTKALILLGFLCPVVLFGAPLTEAHVSKVLNIVKLVDPANGERPAKLDDVVRDEIAVTTGIKSRSELLFQDNTLTRLGPESYFSFKTGTRDMTLQKGTLLLQVPKGIGGAKIHTASVTAVITGTTIMLENVPGKDIKMLVLEGTLRLSMDGRFADSLLLTPGNMVMMSPHSKRIPDPVMIDLKKVVQTSTLVNMPSGRKGKDAGAIAPSLPSLSLIEKEITKQQAGKNSHQLVDTKFVIVGKGTTALFGPDLMYQLADRTSVAVQSLATSSPPVTPSGSPPPPGPTPPPPPPPPTPHR